jgi:hypothetical protein
MTAGPTPAKSKVLKRGFLVALGLFILVILGSAIYAASHNKSKKVASLPATWSEYRDTKYGFKFSYPSSWGKPQVSDIKGVVGDRYQITFVSSSKTPPKASIGMAMDSSDFSSTPCPASGCPSGAAMTATIVKSNISASAKNFAMSDSTSYALVINSDSSHISTLNAVQIVSLPKLKVSAASLLLSRRDADKCPERQLASSTKGGCVTSADYNLISQVLKSMQAI